ncbi:CHRD domain-containing protein, partial [Kaarinaea lacus]
MLRESYPFFYCRHCLGQYAIGALLLLGISACGNDLSDLNALNGPSVEMVAFLSADQVVSPVPVSSDDEGEAQLVVNLGNNTIAGQVSLQQQENSAIQQVQLRRGFGGRNGAVVLDLSQDAVDSRIWRLPNNAVLDNTDMELLLRGGMHVLVTTATHNNGELRGQLLQWDQELLVNPLSSDQLVNLNDGDDSVSAMSYLSVDFYSGEVRGNIHLFAGGSPAQVSMHVGLAGTVGEEILLYEPDSADGSVWSIPDNKILEPETLQQLEAAQLYVQVTSADYPQGAIRGQLYLPYYVVRVTDLTGLNLAPEVNSP